MDMNAIKYLKPVAWVVGSIVALMLLVMALSPVAKWVLNHRGQQLIGRTMHAGHVLINPFTGAVEIRDFHCMEPNEETDFVSFERLYVQVNYPRLVARQVDVRHVHLETFTGQVLSRDTSFNFSDIVTRFQSDEVSENADTMSGKWNLMLNDIALSNGHLVYRDVIRGSHWAIEHFNLHVPGLYLGNQQSNAGLHFDLPTGGTIRLTAGYVAARRRFALTVKLEDVATEYLQPIFDSIDLIHGMSARLGGSIHLTGGLDALESLRADVDLGLTGLDLGQMLNLEGIKVRDFHYDVESLTLAGKNISLRGENTFNLRATLSDGGRLTGTYTGNLDPKTGNGHLYAKVTGVQMTRFSPITEALMAYPIQEGTMAFESNTDIRGGQLLSLNRMTMDQLKIGNRKRLTRAPYKNIPLKTGVSLLRSAQGIIVLDLPVQGDLRAPKFDFSKIIGRAFLKVFFGPLMGVRDNRKLISSDEANELQELLGED